MSPDGQQMIVDSQVKLYKIKRRRQGTINIVAWKQRTLPHKCVHTL